jgi:hypothetical protein
VFLAKNGIENLGENRQKTAKKSPKNRNMNPPNVLGKRNL